MHLDIKKAFLSPFSGKGWFWKVTLYGILNIINFALNELFKTNYNKYLLLAFLVCFPLGLIIDGYSIQYVHNQIHDVSPLLPNWRKNIKSYFNKGIEWMGICLSYILILALLITPFVLILTKIVGIYSYFVTIPIVSLFLIIAMIVFQIEKCEYSKRFKFADCYEWQNFYGLISKVKKEIFISLFFIFLITGLSAIFGFIMGITNSVIFMIFEIIILPYIIAATCLIPYNLSTQTYKIAKYRLDEDKIENTTGNN